MDKSPLVGTVTRLRHMTGAPVIECRNALEQSNGDLSSALLALRKRGTVLLSQRPKIGVNGVCASIIGPDGKTGVLLEINCETDFAAKTEMFTNMCRALGERLLVSSAETTQQFLDETGPDWPTAREFIAAAALAIDENIELRRFARYTLKD